MSPHARRVIATRLITAILLAAYPAAWAVGATRRWHVRRTGRVPRPPADGAPLTPVEAATLAAIARDWDRIIRDGQEQP